MEEHLADPTCTTVPLEQCSNRLLCKLDRCFPSFRVNFKPGSCLLDLDHLENLLDSNTRLVALGAAANSCGSITDITAAAVLVRRLSPKALLYVDGVHYAPHRLPDVQVLLGGGYGQFLGARL